MSSIDEDIIQLNDEFKQIKDIRVLLERIRRIRSEFEIINSKNWAPKIEYIELMEKLAYYEEKKLLDLDEAILIHKEILEIKKSLL